MKNKILVLLIIILLPIAVISFMNNKTNFNLSENKISDKDKTKIQEYTINLKDNNNNVIELNLEDYIVGVVAGEMPASFDIEALKAQAIASRTYAMYKKSTNNTYDVTATTSDQVYLTKDEMKAKWQDSFDKYYNKILSAVYDTKGLVIKYDDEIIVAYYFAMSNGYTENAQNVFKEQKNYLVSVESSGEDQVSKNFEVTTEFEKKDFCNKLSINCNNGIFIDNINTNDSGRVQTININGTIFSGIEIRNLLGLRSTDFNVLIKNEKLVITTKGYGHGVGMSQYGANVMAQNGNNYKQIIQHYYKDVYIESI